MTFNQALYEEPVCRIMVLLHNHTLVNIGEDKCFTLSDMEALKELKAKK